MESDVTDLLVREATRARDRAYAPYSRFKVGAAVLGASGKIYAGCNVENAVYGATLCAEQTAIAKAVSEGETEVRAVAVVADTSLPCTPCGACRQVIAEFGPDAHIVMANLSGQRSQMALAELLPQAFSQSTLTGPHPVTKQEEAT